MAMMVILVASLTASFSNSDSATNIVDAFGASSCHRFEIELSLCRSRIVSNRDDAVRFGGGKDVGCYSQCGGMSWLSYCNKFSG